MKTLRGRHRLTYRARTVVTAFRVFDRTGEQVTIFRENVLTLIMKGCGGATISGCHRAVEPDRDRRLQDQRRGCRRLQRRLRCLGRRRQRRRLRRHHHRSPFAHSNPARHYAGASYVVFGTASGFPATFELSSLDGNNGFKISGEVAGRLRRCLRWCRRRRQRRWLRRPDHRSLRRRSAWTEQRRRDLCCLWRRLRLSRQSAPFDAQRQQRLPGERRSERRSQRHLRGFSRRHQRRRLRRHHHWRPVQRCARLRPE